MYLRDRELKTISGCVDCSERDPDVLEWDHVRGDKKATVSSMIQRGYGPKAIDEERAKCEVRCANCHKRKSRKQLGHLEGFDILPKAKWLPDA